MTEHTPTDTNSPTPATGDQGRAPREPGFTEPAADRPPTTDEERAAERAAKDVDTESVGEHYREAMETGANVRGEGEIEP